MSNGTWRCLRSASSIARIAVVAGTILGGAMTGNASADGFVRNYEGWRQLGPDGQAGYAMAIFDALLVFVPGDQYATARAVGLRRCGERLQLQASMLAGAISKFYEDHPESRNAPPFVAFNGYLERGACSPFINAVRDEMGLNAMESPDTTKP
jgi:hypothetical protein